MENWESGDPIASYPSGDLNGLWYPACEVYVEREGSDGAWEQKFILNDGTSFGRYPVDRAGAKADLSDPQFRIDQWKTLKTQDNDGDSDAGGD